jgi:hypothetical protein
MAAPHRSGRSTTRAPVSRYSTSAGRLDPSAPVTVRCTMRCSVAPPPPPRCPGPPRRHPGRRRRGAARERKRDRVRGGPPAEGAFSRPIVPGVGVAGKEKGTPDRRQCRTARGNDGQRRWRSGRPVGRRGAGLVLELDVRPAARPRDAGALARRPAAGTVSAPAPLPAPGSTANCRAAKKNCRSVRGRRRRLRIVSSRRDETEAAGEDVPPRHPLTGPTAAGRPACAPEEVCQPSLERTTPCIARRFVLNLPNRGPFPWRRP